MFKKKSIYTTGTGLNMQAHKRLGLRFWLLTSLATVAVIILGFSLFFLHEISPRNDESTSVAKTITIQPGSTAAQIAANLEQSGLIRSAWSFKWYTVIKQSKDQLQAGQYHLSSDLSVAEIVDLLKSSQSNTFKVTIVAGSTLSDLKQQFSGLGYSSQEIEAALRASYDSPLLSDKPADASLEGYIYPETFQVQSSDSLKTLLKRYFAEFYSKIKENQLKDKLAKHDLTLHEAITLASIIQMEVYKPANQKKVAQVFFKRLEAGMPLGADATAIYGAKKAGLNLSEDSAQAAVTAINYDSPYNTRIHKGLPPGPISNMELSALLAVASPTNTDYLYYVTGDDGITHFSKTVEQHNSNVNKYCQQMCR